ncbi:hypothetical protein Gotri_016867 [Gossypium trilobum]|uniref:Mitoferrin-like n=1 Tax=Gossypium trilobum TaxID=34281 RepID=A0A7J9E4S2_9ROSI|nr:hypothetical protein [Gossypium trilobum]
MATDASPQLRSVPPPSDFHPEISLSQSPTHDGLHFWQFMIAGSIAGTVEHMAMFPLDTLKTRMQALGASCSVQPVSVRQALGSILKLEGPPGLYRGIAAMGLGAGPAHAVYFSVYELSKQVLSRGDPNNSMVHAASGVVATVSPDTANDERLVIHATAGAGAGALAAALTTPLDVVKTQLQCQGVCGCDKFSSSSIGNVIETIVKKDGYRGLMRGWIPRTLFHAPAAAICWSIYEASKSFFQQLNSR